LLIAGRRGGNQAQDSRVWGRNIQHFDSFAESFSGVRTELSQQKCRATWPRFGGLHNYPSSASLKK